MIHDALQSPDFVISLITILTTIIIGVLQIILPPHESISAREKSIKTITYTKCESFQREVYPKFVSLLRTYTRYSTIFDNISFDNKTKTIFKSAKIHPNIKTFLDNVMFLFNDMDSFAAYILDDTITDEAIAFSLQGKAFCDIIDTFKLIYDMYICANPEAYVSLDRLYRKWSIRLIGR